MQNPDLDDDDALEALGKTLLVTLLADAREVILWEPVLDLDDPDLPGFPSTHCLSGWASTSLHSRRRPRRRLTSPACSCWRSSRSPWRKRLWSGSAKATSNPSTSSSRLPYHLPHGSRQFIGRSWLRSNGSRENSFRKRRRWSRNSEADSKSRRKRSKSFNFKSSKAEGEEREELIEQARAQARLIAAMDAPELPRLIADDVTAEKLASLMTANAGRLGILSPEGGIFAMMAGRYSSEEGSPTSLYISRVTQATRCASTVKAARPSLSTSPH